MKAVASALILVTVSLTLAIPGEAQAYNATGYWFSRQQLGGFTPDPFQLNLVQNPSGAISGTAFVRDTLTPTSYALFSVSGSVSGDTVTLDETSILINIPPPNEGFWCRRSGTLTFSSETVLEAHLSGTHCLETTWVLTRTNPPPFGSFDTPANNTTNAAGGIGLTGWALTYTGLPTVAIYRDPLPTEGAALVFVGFASFIQGARPDVAAAFPNYPYNTYGWGFQVLTNELPGTGEQPLGNGTYTFHAIATDLYGVATDLGTKVVSVNNAGSPLPFGTIDTPAQGGHDFRRGLHQFRMGANAAAEFDPNRWVHNYGFYR
jgi:hypothetical protein